jgi:hypothetical protein
MSEPGVVSRRPGAFALSANRRYTGGKMNLFQLWLTGYYSPARVVDELKTKPAPHWGFYAQLTRALLDSLLLYLPLAILGREPSTPSYLTFLSAERYFLASVFFVPVFLLAHWVI